MRAHLQRRPPGATSTRAELPTTLPPLPAATEVAALRIVTEAVANADRHAQATHVTVGLAVHGGDLHLTVVDDGVGVGERPGTGVGIGSMTERAAELGGRVTITPAAGGGTRVHAVLPARPDGRQDDDGPDPDAHRR